MLRCPNPDHKGGEETNASLRLQAEGRWVGHFKCRACAYTGTWNDLAKLLKLDDLNLDELENLQIFSETELNQLSA